MQQLGTRAHCVSTGTLRAVYKKVGVTYARTIGSVASVMATIVTIPLHHLASFSPPSVGGACLWRFSKAPVHFALSSHTYMDPKVAVVMLSCNKIGHSEGGSMGMWLAHKGRT